PLTTGLSVIAGRARHGRVSPLRAGLWPAAARRGLTRPTANETKDTLTLQTLPLQAFQSFTPPVTDPEISDMLFLRVPNAPRKGPTESNGLSRSAHQTQSDG